jgi:hypothetical protein
MPTDTDWNDNVVSIVRAQERPEEASRFRLAAQPLLDALESASIDTADFGKFGWALGSQFDFERAVPIIIEWLPRIADSNVKDAMVRSLTGQPTARGEGARRLLAEFHRPEYSTQTSLLWAIGNALATVAGPADADDIIEILQDRSLGTARQMFCGALMRTHNSRRIGVLIALIEDDDVAGHAILALRQGTYRRRVPEPQLVRPKLEALLTRSSASPFAKRQAKNALRALESPFV